MKILQNIRFVCYFPLTSQALNITPNFFSNLKNNISNFLIFEFFPSPLGVRDNGYRLHLKKV